ncbi:energy-coupling factor ABC transporter ATP-binding protein [Paenibacillus sp. HN-1]|uniref:ABC transporter ATP-binding protein n=1 Tax=Paenibacillus TaxID=44249 RepID=UPI001CA9F881|nr:MULTISPECIES: ABC transporter ATP-binding protein [Paenibacillus]MBY9080401.1 energy-coupling factor ABC transporter ATP-binding protein [Paenibacillus sp. CGMCC 1.18879]MBY9083981.1 energy-coupling factor ABC transporter ATP-binding protein [Paenibacillus sinensis]
MIALNDVTFRYGHDGDEAQAEPGVRNISLKVPPGQCVVLCGRSGCGKSTILRLINGLAPNCYPGKIMGEVLVDGKNPAELPPEERTRKLGVVFQDPRSQFFMDNVRDELAFSAENLGLPAEFILERIERQAEMLGIAHLLDRKLARLSSGQKQRVAIAAASILAPPLLILDEPTANLDEQATKSIVEILGRLKREGTTLVISEHRLHALLPIADSFVCMEQGRISRQWSKEQFAALSYAEVRPYGLRHPDMVKDYITGRTEQADPLSPVFAGHGLGYRHKRSAEGLTGVDLALPKGTVTALTGENGAGKTTLGKILSGLLRQRSGKIVQDGAVLSASQRRAMSYLVMQDADYQLYADSVGNELVLGRHIDETLRRKAFEAMEAFGLSALQGRHPASLSGGEKQRVTMAAAYCSDAELIILDEPTSGLDGEGVLHVVEWVRKLAWAGKTVILITHDPILTRLACDHVVELTRKGEDRIEQSNQARDTQIAGIGR